MPASPTWPAAWRARAWAAYARGDSLTAHVLWACATDLEEAVMPRIIPRAEWGWDGWAGTPATVPTSKRTEFFVHYEGPPTGGKTGPSVPRAIHAYHKSVGWSGIGYTWVVTQDGAIYEGRGWDLSGAHCPGHNTSGWSVQIHIGGDETPSPEALTSARWLYDQAVARAGRRLTMLGHVEGGASTSCPGKKLLAWVHAGMPAGAPSDTTPQTVWGEGDTGPEVERIQRIVGTEPDGDWGPLTTAAVKAWQTTHGLDPDGLWGPLCEAAASTTPTTPTLTEDDMALTEIEIQQIASRIIDGTPMGPERATLASYLAAARRDAGAALAEVKALRAELAGGGGVDPAAVAAELIKQLGARS